MRKSFIPLAFVAVLGMTGAALANETVGTIEKVDQANHMVMLTDGTSYVFGTSKEAITALQSFNAGDQVRITWTEPQGADSNLNRDASMISGVNG